MRGEFARLDKEFGGGDAPVASPENLITVNVTVEELKIKSAKAAGTGKIEGKLITKERRTTGSVSWKSAFAPSRRLMYTDANLVYGSYLKAGRSHFTLPFVILAVLGMQACQISNSYTLVWWQQKCVFISSTPPSPHSCTASSTGLLLSIKPFTPPWE
jgi:hypothetical protein